MRTSRGLAVAGAGTAAALLMGLSGTQALAGPGSNAYGGRAGAAATPSVAAPGSAVPAVGTATTVGQVTPPAGAPIDCGDLTGVQTASGAGAPSYTVPTDGVVTGFSHNAGPGAGQVRGVLFRPTAVMNNKTIIGKSALVTLVPDTTMAFPAQVTVKAGDQLGIQIKGSTGGVDCVFAGVPGDSHVLSGDDPDLTSNFVGVTPVDGNRWNISATLEPDADHDGYGDVSQDQCPQFAAAHVACPAPETTITKQPKKSSSKRKGPPSPVPWTARPPSPARRRSRRSSRSASTRCSSPRRVRSARWTRPRAS
jgi:hypothetical protein